MATLQAISSVLRTGQWPPLGSSFWCGKENVSGVYGSNHCNECIKVSVVSSHRLTGVYGIDSELFNAPSCSLAPGLRVKEKRRLQHRLKRNEACHRRVWCSTSVVGTLPISCGDDNECWASATKETVTVDQAESEISSNSVGISGINFRVRGAFRHNMKVERNAGLEGGLTEFIVNGMARLQLIGVVTILALGIGVGAAAASISGPPNIIKRRSLPCFASVSSVVSGIDLQSPSKDVVTAKKESESPVELEDRRQKGSEAVEPLGLQTEQGNRGDLGGDQTGEVDSPKMDLTGLEVVGDKGQAQETDDIEETDDVEEGEDEDEDEEEDENEELGDNGYSDEELSALQELEGLDEAGDVGSAIVLENESGNVALETPLGEVDAETEKELKKAYEEWRSQPYALTVPLRIVGLRGSVPPIWLKEFMESQGKRVKLVAKFPGSLQAILADLASALEQRKLTSQSAMAADLVTVGDSWLTTAVQGGLIEPIKNPEQFDWFQQFLRRNKKGMVDPNGPVWGVPYRWGSLVIAYRTDKFKKNGITPITDWADLWIPQLAGMVAMVNSPREVVGSVLKSIGASYNTQDFNRDVPGGREAVKERFVSLQKQIRLFDDVQYLKAMAAGDVWVAVGWSSDVILFAKRSSHVAVIAPQSGTSLWADLWAIPATTSFRSDKVGGRVRGPSPLTFQWLDFCLQPARAITFQQDVFVGASPLYLSREPECEANGASLDKPNQSEHFEEAEAAGSHLATISITRKEEVKVGPKIETNIINGMPPQDIVAKSEFLEPLSEQAVADYEWLLSEPVEVQGWPSGLLEFLKGAFQGCLQWARSRRIRS